jgi:putative transposase
MPQSLARLHVHLVFSTKHRVPLIHESIREPLHRYMAVVLENCSCRTVLINSVEDHVHLLFNLGRTVSIADAVEEVKTTSSKWMKTQGPDLITFAWQKGYGAFAVSESHLRDLCRYIERQREHHGPVTFQDEYRRLLDENQVRYDERYVWD